MEILCGQGGDPVEIVARESLAQVRDDGAIQALVDQVLGEHPDELERFRTGESKLVGFFMGRVMRAAGGVADPAEVKRVLLANLTG